MDDSEYDQEEIWLFAIERRTEADNYADRLCNSGIAARVVVDPKNYPATDNFAARSWPQVRISRSQKRNAQELVLSWGLDPGLLDDPLLFCYHCGVALSAATPACPSCRAELNWVENPAIDHPETEYHRFLEIANTGSHLAGLAGVTAIVFILGFFFVVFVLL